VSAGENGADPKLPRMAQALDRDEVAQHVAPILAKAGGWRSFPEVLEARLVRHKPGRRCVIYYRLAADPPVGVYAKMRAKGADLQTQELLEELLRDGLDHAMGSPVGVPRPLGCFEAWNMTFQEASPGRLVNEILEESGAERGMGQVAEAIFALHRSGVSPKRQHGVADELKILRTRLDDAAARAPHRRARIERVRDGCTALANLLPQATPAGLHRDFYPDQVIVDGPRTTLLDLDLFAAGNPALDVGNFSAHLAEMALRERGDMQRYSALEGAFEERYLELSDETDPASIRGYRLLTLARHIQLSMTIPGRAETSEAILDACEAELG
jgi:hypothetical protein